MSIYFYYKTEGKMILKRNSIEREKHEANKPVLIIF